MRRFFIKKNNIIILSSVFTVLLIIAAVIIVISNSLKVDNDFSYYKKLNTSNHLYVIRSTDLSDAELVMIETLQGIVAQKSAEIYIEAGDNYKSWLEDLKANYNVSYEYVSSPWDLIARFKSRLNGNGFIQYKLNTESVNVACTLSGILNCVAIDTSLSNEAQKHGLVLKMDVGDKDEKWVFDNYKQNLDNHIIIQQAVTNLALRDYGAAVKGLYYYGENKAELTYEVFKWVKPDSPVLGWGPGGEETHVGIASMMHLFTIASDHAYNFSVFSGLPGKSFKQKKTRRVSNNEKNVHYVTFIMSDGDNVQWLVNSFTFDKRWFGSKKRGEFPAGWSISPSLVDLAPNVMKYCYNKATENDYFVASVSGNGYIYPSEYGDDELNEFTARMNKYFKRTDLKYVSIMESPNETALNKYAAQNNVAGGFLFYGPKYMEGKGGIYWYNGKPFIAVRESLWGEDPLRMAVRLNSYMRNPKRIEGYTLVNVHPWSHSYDDIYKIVKRLDSHVKVVTPNEFMDLINKNIEKKDVPVLDDIKDFDYSNLQPEKEDQYEYIDLDRIDSIKPEAKYEYNFASGLEGWDTGTSGKQYDKAEWSNEDGGSLRLDGSDLGNRDELPNSWFNKKITLPKTGKVYFNFDIRSMEADTDADVRVEAVDRNKNIKTLLEWTTIKGKAWTKISVDMTEYAGQDITIFVEQNDSGEGSGEILYIDKIKISVEPDIPARN